MMSIAEEKKRLRTAMLHLRRAYPTADRHAHSQTICRHLAALIHARRTPRRTDAGSSNISILSYMAMRDEVDLTALHHVCLAQGHRLFLPRVVPHQPGELTIHEVFGDTQYESNRWGIREPVVVRGPSESISVTDKLPHIDVLLVPGVAYDQTGVRLGFGGGFYDRLWQRFVRAGVEPYVIAPAFSFQIVAHVPREEHDMQVHELVTERD
jgi:5-formyltetrahydrofolate cyclo-ligase